MNRLVDRSLAHTLKTRALALENAERRLSLGAAGASPDVRALLERHVRIARDSLRTAENVAIQYVAREVTGLLGRAFA